VHRIPFDKTKVPFHRAVVISIPISNVSLRARSAGSAARKAEGTERRCVQVVNTTVDFD
jgi:hypothetical protein